MTSAPPAAGRSSTIRHRFVVGTGGNPEFARKRECWTRSGLPLPEDRASDQAHEGGLEVTRSWGAAVPKHMRPRRGAKTGSGRTRTA
jgi:hypothetical protein